jgi:glucosyl-dolichyl phosphate glucuronosyltransferase
VSTCPFVSVIIPTYNRGNYLRLTLDSFLSQTYPNDRYEIIVSNNNSTDRTESIIRDYLNRFRSIKMIFENRQGVHYARNSAAKTAKGDILYFTDDDMIADKDLLMEIVKPFDLDTGVGTVTGLVLPRWEADPPSWVKKYLINGYLSLTNQDMQEELIISKRDFGVYSCHQGIRRDVFFKSGGFNPENTAGVWIGDGETGLNIKMKLLGYKFAYTARAIIYHMIPESRMTLRYLLKRIGNQGFCDSYTEYRGHRNKVKIIPIMLKRNTIGVATSMGLALAKLVLGKHSWHFVPAQMAYLYKRTVYDLRLYRNDSFREMVEIDDWINNDADLKSFCLLNVNASRR